MFQKDKKVDFMNAIFISFDDEGPTDKGEKFLPLATLFFSSSSFFLSFSPVVRTLSACLCVYYETQFAYCVYSDDTQI